MAVGFLFTVPQDPGELAQWSFANMAHHVDIARVIFEKGGGRIDQFLLDPINLGDPAQWVYLHQLAHNQQNRILGIQGQDLTGVDFTNPDIFESWVYIHANEHYQAGAILGLG